MDAFFDGLDCRLRVSGMLADSIMMGIVNSAMEDAYEKSCSREGDLERLTEKSRFCELAIIQLEWCLKFLQEETDSSSILESTHDREKLLSELLETRDRIHNRLGETKLAIALKDRESKESLSRLRLTLEEKDDDISFLNSALRLERVKPSLPAAPPRKLTVAQSFELRESKSNVDHQVRKIRGNLESCYRNLTDLMQEEASTGISDTIDTTRSGFGGEDEDEDTNHSRQRMGEDSQSDGRNLLNFQLMEELKSWFHEMAADVEALRENIDSSLKMMEDSVSFFKLSLDEQHWVWSLEEGIIDLVLRSFLEDLQQRMSAPGVAGEYFSRLVFDPSWSDFMNDVIKLHSELEMLIVEKEIQPTAVSSGMDLTENISERSITSGVDNYVEEHDSAGASRSRCEKTSDRPSKVEKSGSPEVLSKGEPLLHSDAGTMRPSMLRNVKQLDFDKVMISKVTARLESIIKVNDTLLAAHHGMDYGRNKAILKSVSSRHKFMDEDQTFRENLEQPNNWSCFHFSCDEIQQLKQELEDLNTKTMILEETYAILFKGLTRNLLLEFIDDDVGSLLREDMHVTVFSEMVKEWNNVIETRSIERSLMDNIYHIVFANAFKEIKEAPHSNPLRCKEEEDLSPDNCMSRISITSERIDQMEDVCSLPNYCDLESLIRETTYLAIFSTMVKEWKDEKETCDIQILLTEEIYHVVLCKVLEDIIHDINSASTRCQAKDLHVGDDPCQSSAISEKLIPIQEGGSLSASSYVEKRLEFNLNLEPVINDNHHDIVGHDLRESSRRYLHTGQLLAENDDDSLASGKSEKVLQQRISSKVQLRKSASSLDIPLKVTDDIKDANQDEKDLICLPAKYEERQRSELDFMMMRLTKFSRVINDFEHMTCSKLGRHMSRLKIFQHQLDSLAAQVNSIMRKELLYRKAFKRRCYDLQTAEAEVDLLGDQVDQLFGLMERIYRELDYYSPVLQHSGVTDILRLMQTELQEQVASVSRQ